MTYAELARMVEVTLCSGCELVSPGRHRSGTIEQRDDEWVAHWTDRRLNRVGMFNFLRKLRRKQQPLGSPLWMKIHHANVEAVNLAAMIGRRVPGWYSDSDRHHVRWLLRDPAKRQGNPDAERAWNWASYRSETRS